ncbi:hypothetical protein KSP40_PGU017886 [Platanthera guangdongensis]|uniref:TAFII55 protein conserved region domain-containing protein n=1 Tax=Platanthera guangdongensis TaxID=2320717 RepID=A0ABR2MU34_9ASPA
MEDASVSIAPPCFLHWTSLESTPPQPPTGVCCLNIMRFPQLSTSATMELRHGRFFTRRGVSVERFKVAVFLLFPFEVAVSLFFHGEFLDVDRRNLLIAYCFYDGRTGTFSIGNEQFPASLLDLPGIVESYKTYDDTVLIKTADVGQIILVRKENDPAPEGIEYRHGLTPPMRDARRRRFRREPDLNVFHQTIRVSAY